MLALWESFIPKPKMWVCLSDKRCTSIASHHWCLISKSWSQWFSCHLPTENEERFH